MPGHRGRRVRRGAHLGIAGLVQQIAWAVAASRPHAALATLLVRRWWCIFKRGNRRCMDEPATTEDREGKAGAVLLMEYDAKKKSPLVAFLLAFVYPGLGHLYAGSWLAGIFYATGPLWGMMVAVAPDLLGWRLSSVFPGLDVKHFCEVWFQCALAGCLLVWMYQLVSATSAVRAHNTRVRLAITGEA